LPTLILMAFFSPIVG